MSDQKPEQDEDAEFDAAVGTNVPPPDTLFDRIHKAIRNIDLLAHKYSPKDKEDGY